MKLKLTLALLVFCFNLSGQTDPLKGRIEKSDLDGGFTEPDSVPLVEYVHSDKNVNQPEYFIDGKFINSTLITTIDPKLIDSLRIENDTVKINNRVYSGQVHLVMKDEYNPKFISLTGLKLKYLKQPDRQTIFLIDNQVVRDDYNGYLVDESYLLKVVVDSVLLKEDQAAVYIVKLITKTEENIKRAREIRIRGEAEVSLIENG